MTMTYRETKRLKDRRSVLPTLRFADVNPTGGIPERHLRVRLGHRRGARKLVTA
jgi:hypothetical protein